MFDMDIPDSVVDVIAERLYDMVPSAGAPRWDELCDEEKEAWVSQARLVLDGVVGELTAAARERELLDAAEEFGQSPGNEWVRTVLTARAGRVRAER